MKVESTIPATLVSGARVSSPLDCTPAQALMSPFIDSMTTPEETDRLQSHVSQCERCRRQLQSLISLRNLLARIEPAKAPEDLVLDTRVKLSRERNRNPYDWLETQINNVLKPLAIPAIFGVSFTLLFFGVLWGSMVSNATVMAQEFQEIGRASCRV